MKAEPTPTIAPVSMRLSAFFGYDKQSRSVTLDLRPRTLTVACTLTRPDADDDASTPKQVLGAWLRLRLAATLGDR